MNVRNIHERTLNAPAEKVGLLIDRLASQNDLLWPIGRWPPMRFDRPLGVGAVGGHGPIRYVVESYSPRRNIQFRFTEPQGFVGVHRFEIESVDHAKSILRHVIEMKTAGASCIAWMLLIRPLHNALMEDALDRADAFAGRQLPQRKWSPWVKFIRAVMRRLKRQQ